MSFKPRIGIIMSTTRPGRFGDTPTQWIHDIARQRTDSEFEVVDLRDYPLPLFEEKLPLVYAPVENPVAKRWAATIASFDGYIFVTAEYNHSVTGALKNALDHLYAETHRKPATFVGYGGVGGSRAVEHLRHILAELHVATLKHAVHIGMVEMIGMLREGRTMADYPHLAEAAKPMLDDLVWWSITLKAGRAATA
ncbi:NAD(P)H-dependent oxidoreductase [Hyphomicrobium sp. CS1GBMeth3]|uniref:NADPH-dependent FMN reductase n=1 Tax=Hyphomicrobium sp. CS1GBMeth3 TaxID=1892845 RepID=UPI000931DE8F|nr:NAD(P)H-dependent oxidoreductase [Hyphomicrobium sp. CS1GBMeth3]